MINKTTLEKLEYKKVLNFISNYTSTENAKLKLITMKIKNNTDFSLSIKIMT